MHARRPRIQVTDRFRAAPSSHRGEARKVVDMEITSRSLEPPEPPAGRLSIYYRKSWTWENATRFTI
jgi:hypothetical protein